MGLCECLHALVERLVYVWRDWIVFGGESCVYVSVEGEVWNLEGQTGLHGCVHEDKELYMEDVSRSCVWRKCLFQWRKRWIFLGLCMCG